ncbi:DNA-J related domain-containing protein [Paraglaciecola sp.]|uniref:DNA-J related domain-containing protein n=1 Tax=Paraglaciecola sp. TaxID=1920173 RepID=UPI0030F40FC7
MRHHLLEKYVLDILTEHPQGISEYQLIVRLQNPPYNLFDKMAMSDTLSLFQCHFVLFHSLYQIRARSLVAQQFDVKIETTNIKILPYVRVKAGLCNDDKLQNYYLDWQNFSGTTEQDVESLLSQFWQSMAGGGKQLTLDEVTLNKITEAYKKFDLPFDSAFNLVKSTYLRLQHQHHPDKGGNKEQSQQLERQFQVLKRYLK